MHVAWGINCPEHVKRIMAVNIQSLSKYWPGKIAACLQTKEGSKAMYKKGISVFSLPIEDALGEITDDESYCLIWPKYFKV